MGNVLLEKIYNFLVKPIISLAHVLNLTHGKCANGLTDIIEHDRGGVIKILY